MKIASVFATALCVSACATLGPGSRPIMGGKDIPIGKRANVDGPVIRAVKILKDSRCQINARCIRAGDVELAMEWIRSNGTVEPFKLRLSKPSALADGNISLVNVVPGNEAGKPPIKERDYRFTFAFEGGI